MSRLRVGGWVVAFCAALYPTWALWQPNPVEWGPSLLCTGALPERSTWQMAGDLLLLPLRSDAARLVDSALTWAVPALLVLVAFPGRHPSAARPVAGLLTLIALLDVIARPSVDPGVCDLFGEMLDRANDGRVLALLSAAVLVLVTQPAGPRRDGDRLHRVPPDAGRPAGRPARSVPRSPTRESISFRLMSGVAFLAAGHPTYERWRQYLSPPESYGSSSMIYGLVRPYSDSKFTWEDVYEMSLLRSLLADARTLAEIALDWAIPALVVLAFMSGRRSAVAGRRAAAALTLVAVLALVALPGFDSPLDAQWFAVVADHLDGTTTLALLSAAVLVLLATQGSQPEVRTPPRPVELTALGALVGYWVVTVVVTVVIGLTHGGLAVAPGLLNSFEHFPLLAAGSVVGCVLLWRVGVRRWRRRL